MPMRAKAARGPAGGAGARPAALPLVDVEAAAPRAEEISAEALARAVGAAVVAAAQMSAARDCTTEEES